MSDVAVGLGLWLIAPAVLAASGPLRAEGPVSVRLEATAEGGFRLVREGRPYFIRGAGGEGSLALLAACGGNSVRTWGAERLGEVLDEAQRHGLTVCAGIWLGHGRHGFDYHDPEQVARQRREAERVVRRYKDHPALLIWGIGNEMEDQGDDEAIWAAVNDLARRVKRLDPDHPTMTVISEFGEGEKVRNLHRHCPDVDLVGLNSYGPVGTLAERYEKFGGTKPYVVTEFGPPGQWESPKTAWGAAPELTSTQKAEVYRRAYEAAVVDRPLCLGSYAFLWGHKQEATATWFGLLLPDGSRTAAADVLTELWSGRPPANRCPAIEPIRLEGPATVRPGAEVRARLEASDPEGDPLTVAWELRREGRYGSGGDAEAEPEAFPDAIARAGDREVTLTMPREPGPYRLFAYVRDGRGGAATANVPLLVQEP